MKSDRLKEIFFASGTLADNVMHRSQSRSYDREIAESSPKPFQKMNRGTRIPSQSEF